MCVSTVVDSGVVHIFDSKLRPVLTRMRPLWGLKAHHMQCRTGVRMVPPSPWALHGCCLRSAAGIGSVVAGGMPMHGLTLLHELLGHSAEAAAAAQTHAQGEKPRQSLLKLAHVRMQNEHGISAMYS